MLYKVYTIKVLDVIATNYKYFTLCNTKKFITLNFGYQFLVFMKHTMLIKSML